MTRARRVLRRARRMLPGPITDWNHKRIGAVSLVILLAFVGGALLLTSSVFSSAYTLNARFSNAIGLQDGDQVLLAGVAVGKVQSLSVAGDHVDARLAINDEVQLPVDTTADISVETLLGVIGINLEPGGDWGQLLRNGSTITNTAVPWEYFEVQNSAGNLLSQTDAQALGKVVSSLADATQGDKTQIRQVIDGLAALTTTVSNHKVEASQLIEAAETLSATLASKDHQLSTVIDDLDKVVAGLASHSSQLGQLIDATEQAAVQTSSLIGRNQPKLQELLTSLHSALQVVGQHQLDLARSVSYAAAAIKGFSSIGQSGDTTPQWANIYTNLVGSALGYEILGSCGLLDQALDVALGPDPTPCPLRTGPTPALPGTSGTGSGASTTAAGSGGAGTGLAALYSPLEGGSS